MYFNHFCLLTTYDFITNYFNVTVYTVNIYFTLLTYLPALYYDDDDTDRCAAYVAGKR